MRGRQKLRPWYSPPSLATASLKLTLECPYNCDPPLPLAPKLIELLLRSLRLAKRWMDCIWPYFLSQSKRRSLISLRPFNHKSESSKSEIYFYFRVLFLLFSGHKMAPVESIEEISLLIMNCCAVVASHQPALAKEIWQLAK